MYNKQDIINILENPFINGLTNTEYGKMIQCAAEEYVQIMVNEINRGELLVNPTSNPKLIQELKYINNGPGFDRVTINGKKIQIKFRQVDGKTPFSRQTHFSNTRRHSKKHLGKSDSTGMITYGKDEFDYVLVILCHVKNDIRTNYKNWSFSLISSQELVDVNNELYLLPNIPSDKLYNYKCDDIYMLTKKLKEL